MIVTRDVFCSGCAPIKPVEADAERADVERTAEDDAAARAGLDDGTCPATSDWSMAVIRDMSTKEKDPEMYQHGHGHRRHRRHRREGACPKRVYLRNARPASSTSSSTATRRRPVAVAPRTPTAVADNAEHGRHRQGRQLHRQLLHHRSRARREAALRTRRCWRRRRASSRRSRTASPTASSSTPSGRSRSSASIGLQNGDTIKAINGSDMTTPDAALGALHQAAQRQPPVGQVDRRGETVALDYSIR